MFWSSEKNSYEFPEPPVDPSLNVSPENNKGGNPLQETNFSETVFQQESLPETPLPKKREGILRRGHFLRPRFLIGGLLTLAILLGILAGINFGIMAPIREEMVSREQLMAQAGFFVSTFMDNLKTTTDSLNQTLASLNQTKGELSEAYSSLERKKEEIKSLQIEVDTLNRVAEIDTLIQYDLYQSINCIAKGLEAFDYGLYYFAENYFRSALAYIQEANALSEERQRLLGW
ncbi:MAG: hypothetical protein QMD88_02460 [Coprothermobacterota bacterium]|nr:hypothetical protein [Coprothermobacterota bacterium]